MNMRWDLNSLYSSFDSKTMKQDYKKLCELKDFMLNWMNKEFTTTENSINKIETFIKKLTEIYTLHERLGAYAMLTFSVDTKNEKAKQLLDKADRLEAELVPVTVIFMKWLGTLNNFDEVLDSTDLIKEHKFFLCELKEKLKFTLPVKEEGIISKMQTTGSGAWSNLWNNLTSDHLVDITIDGKDKKLPLSIIRNMYHDKDPETRKNAYLSELESYKKIEMVSAACLNAIKGEVITTSKLKNYESPLDMTLKNSRMDKETLDVMIDAIKESLPIFRKYYRQKAEILGYSNGLPFHEIFAPIGKIDSQYTFEYAAYFIVKNFRHFSDELADFADRAFKNNWIDADPREGKRGGAFCCNLRSIKESRVMSNFIGNFSDLITLAHELGHAYHGECLCSELYLNTSYPMPLAETASIFCETIVNDAVLKTASKENSISIIENELSNAGQEIVDIYSRYLFETEIFTKRSDTVLSVDEFKSIIIESQKQAYGNGLDNSLLHPYMWVNKPHYYFPTANFYNFPYAFGLLFANGLYSIYQSQGNSFTNKMKLILSATGKKNIADVAKMADIDINSIDFWRSSLKIIENKINTFIKLTEK